MINFSMGASKYDAKPRQMKAPDVGAFVGMIDGWRYREKGKGYIAAAFSDGHRCETSAEPVRFLHVDVDHMAASVLPDFRMWLAGFSGCGWPTHSSTADAPRERAILVLDRAATRGELLRVGAAFAAEVGRHFPGTVKVDASTFKAEQPCYLPPEGVTLSRYFGDELDVDAWLARPDAVAPVNAGASRTKKRQEAFDNDLVLRHLRDVDHVLQERADGSVWITCPFEAEHTSEAQPFGTSYFVAYTNGFARGHFKCLHDHCAGRTDADYLAALGYVAPKMFTGNDVPGDSQNDDPPPALVQSFDQFIGARKPVVWAVQHMLQRGYIYSLTARWGHGKTAVTLPLALHVAHGMAWAGLKVEQMRVLFLAGENPDDVRLRALQAATVFGMNPEVLANNMYFTTRALNLTAAEQAAVLVDQVAALGIGLCFVDTGVAHSAMEEENNNAEMHELAVSLRRLSVGLGGAAVVCLMHPPKNCTRDTLNTRGGGAFAGEIDGELLLWQDDATKQAELFHGPKLRGPGFQSLYFDLQRHDLDMTDNFGDSVQTVVAVPVDQGSARARVQRETPAQRKALETLMQACAGHLTRDEHGQMRGVHVDDWRAAFYTQAVADTPDAKRQAFHRIRSNLHSAGLVSVCDDFYLPTDAGRLAVLALMKANRDTAGQRDNVTPPWGVSRHVTPIKP